MARTLPTLEFTELILLAEKKNEETDSRLDWRVAAVGGNHGWLATSRCEGKKQ